MRAAAEHPGRPRGFYAASRAAITAVANVSVESKICLTQRPVPS
jgi:hypothetical protein